MTFSTDPEPIERLDSSITSSSIEIDNLDKVRLDPAWIAEKRSEWGEKVIVPEWEEDSDTCDYRAKNGWLVRIKVVRISHPSTFLFSRLYSTYRIYSLLTLHLTLYRDEIW
jgi:hypothetical protein